MTPINTEAIALENIVIKNGNSNKLTIQDRAVHDWYRFVLSFPPPLVRHYLDKFGVTKDQVVLDPFCGTGTTLVEAKILGFPSIGVEANPFAFFTSSVKLNWNIDPIELLAAAASISEKALWILSTTGLKDQSVDLQEVSGDLLRLNPDEEKLLLTNSISPLPLHKILVLKSIIETYRDQSIYQHLRLALANTLVFGASNLHFGPEVGVGKPKFDFPAVSAWLNKVKQISEDLIHLHPNRNTPSSIYNADARNIGGLIAPNSVDVVFTSPPYPNEKDYSRTTRLELVLLDFIHNKEELRQVKRSLIRSNTRGVYRDDVDNQWILHHSEIMRIANEIEARRIALGKDSGFERMYSKVTQLYFGGMARHLNDLKGVLKPGARLGYVVGDQASYLRVMIRTGQILADIAKDLGYQVEGIDLFRTRFASATKEQLREEVVLLRWPG